MNLSRVRLNCERRSGELIDEAYGLPRGGTVVAALSTNNDIQLVTFFLDGEEYGVDLMRVREITGMTDITRTANSPPYMKGVINLRGTIVPIVSLRQRLGMPDPDGRADSCIAIADIGGELTGFIIDEISDVVRVKRSDLQPAPDATGQPWIEGIFFRGGNRNMVVLLNLENFC